MKTTTLGAIGAVLVGAGAAQASFTYLATSGDTLFRVNDDATVETFDLGDSIIAQTVLDNGTVLAFSNTQGNDGLEVYEIVDPLGTPSLSLIGTRDSSYASVVDVNGAFFGLSSGNLFELDASFEIATTDNLGLSGEGNSIGGGAYDPATDTFYIITRDDNVYTVDLNQGDREATLLGDSGVDVFNMGLEFFGGALHAAIALDGETELSVGTIDTATGAFTSIASFDTAPFGGIEAVSVSVLPTPGAATLAAVGLVVSARRRRA